MANRIVEKYHQMISISEGLLCRIYFFKDKIGRTAEGTTGWSALKAKEWAKLRAVMTKSFPDTSELSKCPGFETFQESSQYVIEELGTLHDLIVDLVDFKFIAEDIFEELFNYVDEFLLSKNCCLIELAMDLIVNFIKVFTLLASVDNLKSVCATLFGAMFCAGENIQISQEVVKLLGWLQTPQRSFIDTFMQHDVVIGRILLQLRPIWRASQALLHLHESRTFNFVHETTTRTVPVKKELSDDAPIDLFGGLQRADRTTGHIVFGVLVCPRLLFSEEHFALFQEVATQTLVVHIFRDLSLDLHTEIESLSTNFPAKKDVVVPPRGFKLAKEAKALAKRAVQVAGRHHLERRALLIADLEQVLICLEREPELACPKLPQILSLASLARAEVEWYFEHRGKEGRRDVRKSRVAADYNSSGSDVPRLLYLLFGLGRQLRVPETALAVRQYYWEYLRLTDLAMLEGLQVDYLPVFSNLVSRLVGDPMDEEALAASSHPVARLVQSFSEQLKVLPAPGLGGIDASLYAASSSSSVAQLDALQFDWMRLNRDRFLLVLSLPQLRSFLHSEEMLALSSRLDVMVEHSLYVESYDRLVSTLVSPSRLWWYAQVVMDEYKETLLRSPFDSENACGFLAVCTIAQDSAHEDCPEEYARIGWAAVKLGRAMLDVLTTHAVGLLSALYDELLALQLQVGSGEVLARLQRSLQHPQQGSIFSVEPLPGTESEAWAASSVQKLMLVRVNIVNIFNFARSMGSLSVHGQTFGLVSRLNEAVAGWLYFRTSSLLAIRSSDVEESSDFGQAATRFCNKSTDLPPASSGLPDDSGNGGVVMMERPTMARAKLESVRLVASFALELFGLDAVPVMQAICSSLFFQHSLSPLGQLAALRDSSELTDAAAGGLTDMGAGKPVSPLKAVVGWFSALLQEVVVGSIRAIWNPRSRSLVISEQAFTPGGLHTQSYINPHELQALATLLGVPGVRVVVARLMQGIYDGVDKFKAFIQNYGKYLMSGGVPEPVEKSWQSQRARARDLALGHLVLVGLHIEVCGALRAGLRATLQAQAPSVTGVLGAATASFDAFLTHDSIRLRDRMQQQHAGVAGAPPSLRPLFLAAADLGIAGGGSAGTSSGSGSGGEIDHSLAELLGGRDGGLFGTTDTDRFLADLLPRALADLFKAPAWRQTMYHPQQEGFSGNEHCFITAAATLLSGAVDFSPIKTGTEIESSRGTARAMCEDFIQLSARALFSMRLVRSDPDNRRKPLRAMIILLDRFVALCPLVTKSVLEKWAPMSIIKQCREDISLGIHRDVDTMTADWKTVLAS